MAHIFMNHPVEDYDAWRPHFEADKPGRSAAGVIDVAVLRDVEDPNSVWLVFEADPAMVEPMMQDPERAEKMQAAGVLAPPQIWVA